LAPLSKKQLKQFVVANTKGCHLYAVNGTSSSTALMLRGTCKVRVERAMSASKLAVPHRLVAVSLSTFRWHLCTRPDVAALRTPLHMQAMWFGPPATVSDPY
jgi:hypothetical protein